MLEKQELKRRLDLKMQLAAKHHDKMSVKYHGFTPWQLFIKQRRQQELLAYEKAKMSLKQRYFGLIRIAVEKKQAKQTTLAVRHHQNRLQIQIFKIWERVFLFNLAIS